MSERHFDKPLPLKLRGFRCPDCGPPDYWTLAINPATMRYDASDDPMRRCNRCGKAWRASEALKPDDEYGDAITAGLVLAGATLKDYDGRPLAAAPPADPRTETEGA